MGSFDRQGYFSAPRRAELFKLVCRGSRRTTSHACLARYSLEQMCFGAIPLLSKEGQPRSGGVVCSKSRSNLIDAREALLINRYFRL